MTHAARTEILAFSCQFLRALNEGNVIVLKVLPKGLNTVAMNGSFAEAYENQNSTKEQGQCDYPWVF